MEENNNEMLAPPERGHVCKECGEAFPSKGGLLVHHRWKHNPELGAIMLAGAKKGALARTKSKVYDFTCQICGAKYRSESGLRYHAESKHGGKGYQSPKGNTKCPYCKFVSSKSGVHLHMSIKHGVRGKWGLLKEQSRRENATASKPYECPYCEFASRLKSGLMRHVHQTHPGKGDGIFRIGDQPARRLNPIPIDEPTQTTTMSEKILAIVAEKIYARIMEEMK